jgi:Ca-activated chloride channel homolog
LLDKLALAGRGFASYLTLTESADALAKNLVLKSAYPYLTDVSIDWGGLAIADATPANVPDVYAGQPLVITGRYRSGGTGVVKVNATTAGKRITIPITVTLPAQEDAEAVASLWARRQIDDLEQAQLRKENVAKQVEQIGLKFHLVTDYTSFIAIDRTRVVSNGVTRLVEQPIIVPEGVNPGVAIEQPYSPPPQRTYSSSSSSSSSYDDGDSGGWGGGGRESLGLLFALLLGATWLVVRRAV